MNVCGQNWWVFFIKAKEHRRWWYHLFPSYRGHFQHCFAICEAAPNFMVMIDPLDNICALDFFAGRPAEHIQLVQRAGGKVLFVEFETERPDVFCGYKFRRGCAITCASMLAYLMGLNTPAVTPRGLYKALLTRYGAMEVENVRWRRQQQSKQAA